MIILFEIKVKFKTSSKGKFLFFGFGIGIVIGFSFGDDIVCFRSFGMGMPKPSRFVIVNGTHEKPKFWRFGLI